MPFLLRPLCVGLLVLGSAISVWAHPAELERIEILTQRIEAHPLDPSGYIARASAYSHDGNYALAMSDLAKAAQLGDPVVAAYELGLLHYRMGNPSEAKVELDRFLDRFPNHAPALEQRARLLADLGDLEAAAADYDRLFAVTAQPNPGSYLAAARLFAPSAGATEITSGITSALAMLDRGMARLGVIPQLQQYAIELELRGGHHDRALDRLESLEEILGDGPDWHVQMAELLIRTEKVRQARRHLRRASRSLRALRETPARRALSERIGALEAALAAE